MRRRLVTAFGIAAGLLVAAIVAYVAYSSLTSPIQVAPNTSLTPENCSPGPCADVQGFTMWVSNVRVEADLVRMQVRFKNSSVSTHASPEDLQLIDASRQSSGLVTNVAGCNTWARHEFSGGATFGPIDVCFRATNSSPPFILRWSPDLGVFCCETDIKITPT
ncbi:MAG TPA: hypothetical protein VMW11_05515 [Candidatus Dormibacteraeota bacterium]|nr:hypothetical protein [Candidatus Dormibacteraeota bacterium]